MAVVLDEVLQERRSSPLSYLIGLNVPVFGVDGNDSANPGPISTANLEEALQTHLASGDYSDEVARQKVTAAFQAIHVFAPQRAIELLRKASEFDKPVSTRRLATWVLSRHADSFHADPVADILPGLLLGLLDPDPVAARNVALTLIAAGKPALPVLIRALEDPNYVPAQLQASFALSATTIMIEIGEQSAVPFLQKRLRGKNTSAADRVSPPTGQRF